MEEINKSGGHSAACHAQMYTMGALLRHGSDEQKNTYLPQIAKGELRLQAFSITEPAAGSDTTSIITTAERDGDHYVITGHKNWTSRISESDLALVLARTSHKTENRTRGLTLFLVDLRQVRAEQPDTLEVVPVRTMFNYATNQVHFRGMRVPADHVIGEVDAGFRYVLDGWNAERILLASEAIGDGYWFIERAVDYANKREVFGRQIGANQGVQFPLADAYMKVRAADMMRYEAARLFDEGKHCGAEANMAKHLASEASWAAANVAPGHPRRQRLRRPVRHRTQVPRDPHVPGRPGQQQPDQGVRRHQGARPAPVVLSEETMTQRRSRRDPQTVTHRHPRIRLPAIAVPGGPHGASHRRGRRLKRPRPLLPHKKLWRKSVIE